MKYIYHINGEEREPTMEEWQQMTERFLTMAGLEKSKQKGEGRYAESDKKFAKSRRK